MGIRAGFRGPVAGADLWNEPNAGNFWNRPQSQYFEMWRRGYQRVRAAFPGQLIVGPSPSFVPSTTNAWWGQYLDYVRANNVVPDIISWHSLPGDPVANVAAANATLDARGIPHPRPYQINENGLSNEQNPGRRRRSGSAGRRCRSPCWRGTPRRRRHRTRSGPGSADSAPPDPWG